MKTLFLSAVTTIILILSSENVWSQDASQPAPAPAENPAPAAQPAPAPAEPAVQPAPQPAPAPEPEKKEEPKKVYDTLEVKSEPVKINVEADAILWPENRICLQFKLKQITGMKVISAVPHGQIVKKGDRLVQFDMEELDRRLEDARLEMEATRLNYAKTQIAQKLAILQAERGLMLLRRGRDETVDRWQFTKDHDYDLMKISTEMTLGDAEFSLKSSQREFNQLSKMYEEDEMVEASEEIVLERQRRAVKVAELNFQRAKAKYEWSSTRALPNFIRDEKENLDISLAQYDANIANAEPDRKLLDLQIQQSALAFQRAEKKFHELEAEISSVRTAASPVDGMVLYGALKDGSLNDYAKAKGYLAAGGTLPANTEFITIVDPSKMALVLAIPEKDFSKIALGLKGYFVANAYPERELTSALTGFSTIPDGDKFWCNANLELPADMKLTPGMKGKATFLARQKSNGILIPAEAVGREDGTTTRFVYVLDEAANTPKKVNVQLGFRLGEKYEILDGLDVGMKVLKKSSDGEQ